MADHGHGRVVFVLYTCILVGAAVGEVDPGRHPKVYTVDPGWHPKVYTVDLDVPPQRRWTHVVRDYKDLIIDVNNQMYQFVLPKAVVPLVEKVVGSLEKYLPQPYAAEIRGIAEALNTTLGNAIIPTLVYDLSAFCTSIVAQDSTGQIWHGRNFDYAFKKTLERTAIVVNFQRAGKILYSASTFAGFVGIMTGQRPHGFTISLDQRDDGDLWPWRNALVALLDRKAQLVPLLIRDTLEQAANFNDAITMLSNNVVIAPVYFIVGGVRPGEGAVITRDRLAVKDLWRLDSLRGRWYLVETNYDHWKPIPPKDDRRLVAMKMMNNTGQAATNDKTLFTVLSTHPVYNGHTIYTTLMSARYPEIHTMWVR